MDLRNKKGFPDGIASELFLGALGPIRAFHVPLETQARAGIHGHAKLYTLHALTAQFLDRLRRGEFDAEMRDRILAWQTGVEKKVATLQFASTCEVGRQLGLQRRDIQPMPLSAEDNKKCYVDGEEDEINKDPDGKPEQDVVDGLPAAENATKEWETAPFYGPLQKRPTVPILEEPEAKCLDPHDYKDRDIGSQCLHSAKAHLEERTGACTSLNCQYRRKPFFFRLRGQRGWQ